MGLVTAPTTTAGATGPSTTAYDTTITPNPVSLPSEGFEATSTSELGQQVAFAPGTSRSLTSVVVDMESWACQSGDWTNTSGACTTTPGATFAQPLTLNLYNVGPANAVGSLITSFTHTFNIPYRPTSAGCADPQTFLGADSVCHHGILAPVTFTFPTLTVPGSIVYGIAFNTTHYGASPVGGTGGPYDSLNVALNNLGTGPSVGTDPAGSDSVYQNSSSAGFYCGGPAGTFRIDDGLNDGCWAPYEPAVQFIVEPTCTTTCYVSPSGNDTNSGQSDSPFATIQHAVNTVSSGGTVHVAAGTYNEAVTINQPVTLDGANAGTAGTAARVGESIVTQTSGTAPVFTVNTPGLVTIDGFTGTFTGTDLPGQWLVGGLVFDIQSNNNFVFRNNIVANSTFNNALVYDTSAANSTITNNLFTGSGQVGSNTTGIVGAWGSPSVQANLTITGNTFSGLTETTQDGTPAININDAGGVVQGNTFTNLHQYAILIADKLANLSILGNTFNGVFNSTPGTSQNRGAGVRTFMNPNFAGPVTVAGNTFTNMYHAVDVANDGVPADLTSNNFKVIRNSFVGPFNGGGTGTQPTNSTAIRVAAGTLGTLDGTCNWWGSVGGPAANQYSGSVTVSPSLFASSPLATAPCGVPVAPAITSAASATFAPNVAGTFTVTASGTPAPTFSEVGALPAGITLNPTTGVLSGTTAVGGSFPITVTASNGVAPAATQAFTLTVTNNTSIITSSSSMQIAAGKKVNFTVTTGGHPAATITTVGMPAWMTLKILGGNKAGTAKLGGTGPTVGGNYTFAIHANNGIGPDTVQMFTVHVLAISSVASANFSKSGPPTQSFTITTTGAAAGVTLTATLGGNLGGLTFHDNGNGTATVSGTPGSTARTHTVTVTATSGAAHVTQKLAIGITA